MGNLLRQRERCGSAEQWRSGRAHPPHLCLCQAGRERKQCELRARQHVCRLSEGRPAGAGATPATAPLQGNFGALVQLKQLHPNLKVLISIGGGIPQPTTRSSTGQPARRSTTGVCRLVRQHVHPGQYRLGCIHRYSLRRLRYRLGVPNANDTANFTALMTEFRNELTTLSQTTGKTYQVLADLAAGHRLRARPRTPATTVAMTQSTLRV